MMTSQIGRHWRNRQSIRVSAMLAGLAIMASAGVTSAGSPGGFPQGQPHVQAHGFGAPAPRWDGSYAGITLGYNFGGRDRVGLNPAPGQIGTLRASGAIAGVQAGHNWQKGDTVFGVEGGLNLGNTGDSFTAGTASASVRINPILDLRGRVGIVTGDGLLYATGGLAIARIAYQAGDLLVPTNITAKYTRPGFSLGVGYEHAIDQEWSMRGEYGYSQYRGRTLGDGGVTSTRATPDHHGIRLGVNRRF